MDQKYTKLNFDWGSAPHPVYGADSAPQTIQLDLRKTEGKGERKERGKGEERGRGNGRG